MDDHFNSTYSLQADTTYEVNGTTYSTDSQGRISEFHGDTSLDKAARAPDHQVHLEGKMQGEHAGHLMAASQGGSGKVDNMVRMDAAVNTRDYRAFERDNAALMKDGKEVHLDGYVVNPDRESTRPDAFMVTRTTTDPATGKSDVDHHSWTNYNMAEFELDGSWADMADDFPNPGAVTVDDEGNIVSTSAESETDFSEQQTTSLLETENDVDIQEEESTGAEVTDGGIE